ncbi:MAG: DUF1538 domain-containing protein [Lachnospiraceae bacterium]|nr:DUF1538 domain-containing protein [Lachnospiraceae bacterium]
MGVIMLKKKLLGEKMKESIASVIPIALIVSALAFFAAPIAVDVMLSFVVGSILLIVGLGIFMYGSDNSMIMIGEQMGSSLTSSRNMPLILFVSFLTGVIITMAEPDLQVLAGNVPHINSFILILTVSVGVGLFLVMCMLRILLGIQLKWILIIFYALIFALAYLSDPKFISVAFDSGGVTTGPMTAPFIIALGVGVASIRSDKNAEADSFGLVALCSVGPILSVLLLGFFYSGEGYEIASDAAKRYADTTELGFAYIRSIPTYMWEMFLSLLPILVIFLIFQIFSFKLGREQFIRILIGIGFTYCGLVIFMTGVNLGFSSLGLILGETMSNGWTRFLLIPVYALIGWFVVSAEPAVHVLTKQVEEISAGAISRNEMLLSLQLAIAFAMALSMTRVLTGISILWLVLPGYFIALVLSFFVPQIFTAIAFDSGGVASGPMSATFMLPFAIGVCKATGGNILTDAFGTVALVAMMPLITVQIMGVRYTLSRRNEKEAYIEQLSDTDIIELWEVE